MLGVLRRHRLTAVDGLVLHRPVLGPFAIGLGAVVVTAGFALFWGAADIPPMTVVRVLLYRVGLPVEVDWPASWEAIVWQIRVPRVVYP